MTFIITKTQLYNKDKTLLLYEHPEMNITKAGKWIRKEYKISEYTLQYEIQ